MHQSASAARRHLRDLILIALFAALLSLSAWIAIPFFTLPITLQTFAVFCTVGLLGGKRGTLSILLYLLLGIIGLPVFSGMTGGVAVLLGPSGGFLIGFLMVGIVGGALSRLLRGSLWTEALWMLIGLVLCYLLGTVWFYAVYAQSGEPISILAAVSTCVLPYILPDFCKLALAVSVIRSIRRHLSL